MEIVKQAESSGGQVGNLLGKLMNWGHIPAYKYFFDKRFPDQNLKILDLGCGGGKFIKYLSESNESYKVYGLDHSKDMLRLSRRINNAGIARGQIKLIESNIDTIPMREEYVHIVTALETIQFWPNIKAVLMEIHRVLKSDGVLYILNRLPKSNTKLWKNARLKNIYDYKNALLDTGFSKTEILLDEKPGWIFIMAKKTL